MRHRSDGHRAASGGYLYYCGDSAASRCAGDFRSSLSYGVFRYFSGEEPPGFHMRDARRQFLSEPADRAYRVWGEDDGRKEQKIKRKVQNKSSTLLCTFLFYSAIIRDSSWNNSREE